MDEALSAVSALEEEETAGDGVTSLEDLEMPAEMAEEMAAHNGGESPPSPPGMTTTSGLDKQPRDDFSVLEELAAADPPAEPAAESPAKGGETEAAGTGDGEVNRAGGKNEPVRLTGYESDHSDVYKHIADLPMGEKRRLARYGNKTVRQLLLKDPNKTLHVLVVKNVKVSLDEAMEYSKRPNLSREALKFMAQKRTWTQSRQFLFNLVRNPSTPVDVAIRMLNKLGTNELRIVAKSASIRMPISAAARKLLFGKM